MWDKVFGGILYIYEYTSIDLRLPALAYSDAALSKSGFHFVRLVFKLQNHDDEQIINDWIKQN